MYRKHTVRKREDVTKEAIVEAGVEEVHADRGQDPALSPPRAPMALGGTTAVAFEHRTQAHRTEATDPDRYSWFGYNLLFEKVYSLIYKMGKHLL